MATDLGELNFEKHIIAAYLHDHHEYEIGSSKSDYDRELAIDPGRVKRFLLRTQKEKVERSGIFRTPVNERDFFEKLTGYLNEKGVANILRKGFRYLEKFDLYYPLPSELNATAQKLYKENIFCVIPELYYSCKRDKRIDLMVSVNGLPVLTMELKNRYTGEHVDEAVEQYCFERDATDTLLRPKRCAVHFAVDDMEAMMCSWLCGPQSQFLAFNKGVDGGAGNPDNGGIRTSYIWEDILSKETLSDILENYAWVVQKKDKKTGEIKEKAIWPCYHQLDCVRKLLIATYNEGVGHSYLVQHSAGSGKSYTITWLAYKLASMLRGSESVLDMVIVVTDRVVLDTQLRDNVISMEKLKGKVAWAADGGSLESRLKEGKTIIITTIQKFVTVVKTIGDRLRNKRFGIIIDEAHSSQNGKLSAKMNFSLGGNSGKSADLEELVLKAVKSRKNLDNANYYAFTATPKRTTVERFGTPIVQADGQVFHLPFHEYTMKQAIEERNIMDVLEFYITYSSLYKIVKTAKDDPKFDKKKASRLLAVYAESHPRTIKKKSEIIVEHFLDTVIGKEKVGGEARAMLVTGSVKRAIDYFNVINQLLAERHSPYKAIIAFRGKIQIDGKDVTDRKLNGFAQKKIEEKLEKHPYRLLIAVDMFQTGFDQPLLHTMYVDKKLQDENAVQTLSRVNRRHPLKRDTCIVDFCNKEEDIKRYFQKYYKTVILTKVTDPTQLDKFVRHLEQSGLYEDEEVRECNELRFMGNDRQRLDGVVNKGVTRFSRMDEKEQGICRDCMEKFLRYYPFISSVIQYESLEWEMLYNYLELLLCKLPRQKDDFNSRALIESVLLKHFLPVKRSESKITLEDKDSEVKNVGIANPQAPPQPDPHQLSHIVENFNGIHWENQDKAKQAVNLLPVELSSNQAFVNAVRNSNRETAMEQSAKLIKQMVVNMLEQWPEFCKNYLNNIELMNTINQQVFEKVYNNIIKDKDGKVNLEMHYHGNIDQLTINGQ